VKRGGYEPVCTRVETADAMQEALASQPWDLVISDYRLPQFSAPEALHTLKKSGLDLPIIIVSGKVGEELAVEAMKAGVHDYLMKDSLSRLVPAIERELREAASRRDRVRAEEAMRQGKMEWEAAFDSVSDLVILTDKEGIILRCNSRVRTYFEKDYSELVGISIGQLFYGDNEVESAAFLLPRAMEYDPDEEFRFPTLNGWFSIASYPMRTYVGAFTGMVFIVKDITKRRREEEERRATERELLALYSIAFRLNTKRSSGMIISDLLLQLHNMLRIDFSSVHLFRDGHLELLDSMELSGEFISEAARIPVGTPWVGKLLNGRPLKVAEVGDHFHDTLAAAAHGMGMHAWCALPMKLGGEVTGVLTAGYREGRTFTDREVFLLSSVAGQLAVLIENQTLYAQMQEKTRELERSRHDLRENLKEVKRANIELGRLNVAKNNFIGMASHELKTPITSVMGGVELLLYYSNLEMTNEQRSILESIREGIMELKSLVDDLLSLSRIEAQGLTLNSIPHDLLDLFRETADMLALPLSSRNLDIRFTGSAPPVRVDSTIFRLVARNLLENAIKFTPDGGSITITASVPEGDALMELAGELAPFYAVMPAGIANHAQFCRLDVVDTGIGIPEEERARVFEKFYGLGDLRHHSSGKTEFMAKGSGLGLSIVKGIVEAHGGLVWNSAPATGNGTMFSILLPAAGA
jgi:PAS domain S-box-containing protein